MHMNRLVRVILALAAVAVVALASACGTSESGEWEWASTSEEAEEFAILSDRGDSGAMEEPVPEPAMMMDADDAMAMEEKSAASVDFVDDSLDSGEDGAELAVELASYAQNRIIVHTARMSLVVEEVGESVDRVTGIASELGGWTVSSDRTSRHTGSVAIRVPAASLDEALGRIEGIGLEVESQSVTSQDVTDEYVDVESRLVSLRATRDRLLTFLEQAEEVEDALLVQQELSRLEERIEGMQGRINYLRQTSAFSLIEVSMRVSPVEIEVDPAEDVSLRVGEVGRFRASFTAPEGIDEFAFVWDFGDGTSTAGKGSTLRPDGTRLTATVTHVYEDDRDSPYIVRVDLTGVGEEGIGEGSASMEVEVKEVPTIEVFAGDNQTVEEGDEVEYSASFTRPADLWDFEYQWDFGDGSPTESGSVEDGESRIAVAHEYSDFRPRPYEVTLTVIAMSEVGRVSSTGSFEVFVTEVEGFAVGGWDVGETAKTAVRGLTVVAKVALWVLIWLGIFSPVILMGVGVLVVFRRYGSRMRGWRRGRGSSTSP